MFNDLNPYDATMHVNGQSTVELDGDRATGESYTIAHHLFAGDGEQKVRCVQVASNRRDDGGDAATHKQVTTLRTSCLR